MNGKRLTHLSNELAVYARSTLTQTAAVIYDPTTKWPVPVPHGTWLRGLAVAILIGAAATSLGPRAAAEPALQCGTVYGVQRGDTLFKIAERAYNDGWQYKRVFAANRDVLPDEGSIEIGNQLMIPCLDGVGTAAHETAISKELEETLAAPDEGPLEPLSPPAESTEQVQTEATTLIERASRFAQQALLPSSSFVDKFATEAETIETADDPIGKFDYPAAQRSPVTEPPTDMSRDTGTSVEYAALGHSQVAPKSGETPEPATETLNLMTGLRLEPYAGAYLPDGGMIADLVKRSVEAVAPGQSVRVAFVENWSADLARLSSEGAFDLSFPWLKPDCSRAEQLSGQKRLLCDSFFFSRPFIEVPAGFYVRADDSLVAADDPSALHGKRLCQPQHHIAFDLGQSDLSIHYASTETPKSGLACFVKLLQGQVDVVTLTGRDAEEQIRHLDINDQVTEIEGLSSKLMLHAVVSKSNPRARYYLDLIDQGLDRVMKSGEWFNVVLAHNSRGP